MSVFDQRGDLARVQAAPLGERLVAQPVAFRIVVMCEPSPAIGRVPLALVGTTEVREDPAHVWLVGRGFEPLGDRRVLEIEADQLAVVVRDDRDDAAKLRSMLLRTGRRATYG